MSKLGCRCGHTIADTTDRIPYKASMLPDVHDEEFFNSLADAAQSFAAAVSRGDREQWLQSHGFGEGYPRNESDYNVFSDFVSSLWVRYSRDCYECIACGRLHVEVGDRPNAFASFSPDGGTYRGILRAG